MTTREARFVLANRTMYAASWVEYAIQVLEHAGETLTTE